MLEFGGGPRNESDEEEVDYLISFLEDKANKLSPFDSLLGQEDSTKESPTSDDAYIEPIQFDKPCIESQ